MHAGGCGHSSHGHSKKNEDLGNHGSSDAKQIARDPMCGMEIEIEAASDSTHYGPHTYYFCSKDCYRKFQERPEYFAERMEKQDVA
jgi:Cu+-exporting ATPase